MVEAQSAMDVCQHTVTFARPALAAECPSNRQAWIRVSSEQGSKSKPDVYALIVGVQCRVRSLAAAKPALPTSMHADSEWWV